jgi:hypothetical protein
MNASDGWPLADPRAAAEAVVHRLEHQRIDADRPRRSSRVRRERDVDPRDRPVVHEARH